MIVYAVVASNVSIGALFLAGVLPGLLVGLLIMTAALILSIKRGYGGGNAAAVADLPKFGPALWRAIPSLLLIVFVLCGILGGVFTATEASAVAVVWAFVLAVICYREIPWKALPGLIIGSARTTGLLTREQVPQLVSESLLGFSADPLTILITINLILLVVGIFMDMTPAVLVFTPIFLPVATGLGMDPVHFGILMIANLCIGLCTPPVGTCLFLGSSVGNSNIARVSRAMIPFYAAMLLGLAAITAWPDLSLWLPRVFGAME
jgi:tripartite ATP-independent transporter DctM subunit